MPSPLSTARPATAPSPSGREPRAPGPAYQPALSAYTRTLATLTFILLGAGVLTAAKDAGLSIPDWPLAFHRFIPPFVGNIRFEYTHRVLAGLVSIMTIGLVIWFLCAQRRRWMKWLAAAALLGVILQAVLGGLTVLDYQPPWLTAFHASLAQLFFLTTVALAIFTGRRWLTPAVPRPDASPSIYRLGIITTAVIFAQIVAGAAYRHDALPLWPHVTGAIAVTVLILWTTTLALRRHKALAALRRPARGLLLLLGIQIALGLNVYFIRRATEHAPQPPETRVVAAVIHLLCAALLLATALLLTLRARHELVAASALAPAAPAAAPLAG